MSAQDRVTSDIKATIHTDHRTLHAAVCTKPRESGKSDPLLLVPPSNQVELQRPFRLLELRIVISTQFNQWRSQRVAQGARAPTETSP